MKYCSSCKQEKPDELFRKRKERKSSDSVCKDCVSKYSKEYYNKNYEKKIAYNREYSKKNPSVSKRYKAKNKENLSKKRKINEQQKRLEVVNHYGGKCACCGESRIEFLALDHINNDGNVMRKTVHPPSGYGLYIWIIKNNYPDFFQVLCHNCNIAKFHYGKCPHEN